MLLNANQVFYWRKLYTPDRKNPSPGPKPPPPDTPKPARPSRRHSEAARNAVRKKV